MKLWKVLACIDAGILLAVIACVMGTIWIDDPSLDEKLDSIMGVLILLGLGLAFITDWDQVVAPRRGRRDPR